MNISNIMYKSTRVMGQILFLKKLSRNKIHYENDEFSQRHLYHLHRHAPLMAYHM